MTRLSFVLMLLTAGVACGGAQKRSVSQGTVPTSSVAQVGGDQPAWVAGEMPALYDASTHLMVVGSGPTVDAAAADARSRMVNKVLGPETSRPFASVPEDLQEFAYAPATERYVASPDKAYVRLLAQRVFVVDRLRAWEAQKAIGALADPVPEAFRTEGRPVSEPSSHLDALVTTLAYQRASAFVCNRRMAVSTSTCTPADLGAIHSAVSTFGQALEIRPKYADGVPYRAGDGAQAPVAAEVVWKAPGQSAQPVAGVPLAFQGVAEKASVPTEDDGLAVWRPTTADPTARVSVRIDAPALLGPDAALWATLPATDVGFRILQPKTARVAVFIEEDGSSRSGRDGFRTKLTGLGMGAPTDLPADMQRAFAKGSTPDRATLLALAQRANGSIDLVAVGEMHSQFASRVGARSVWHEAKGTLTLYDVWSGAQLGPLRGTERAVAIGERAASAKALRALGERLALDVSKLLTEHYRTGASAQR